MPIFKEVVDLQDKFNKKVHHEWQKQNYNWDRAVWVECAELMDSMSYKWWKKQEVDYENIKMELVDILHFLLSEGIEVFGKDRLAEHLRDVYGWLSPKLEGIESYRGQVEKIVYWSVERRQNREYRLLFRLELLFQLWNSVTDNEDIFKYYIAKNVLNTFRNKNSYKNGSYIKIWDGKEDNVYVMEELEKLMKNKINNLFDNLYDRLDNLYRFYILKE